MFAVHNKRSFFIYLLLAAVIVAALNFVSRELFIRLDLTANGIYSLSGSSKRVVDQVEDLLTMKVYFTDNLPGQYGNNRRYLQDILEEYEAFGGGRVRFEFFRPEDDQTLPDEARKYGIHPVQLQVVENDKLEVKRVYMGMVFLYGDGREVIPVIESTTGLEYEITTQIKKLLDTDKQAVAFAIIGAQPPRVRNISAVLQQSYLVRNIRLASPVPDDIGLLMISGVTDSLSEDELGNLEAFANRGGNLFIGQGRVAGDLSGQRGTPVTSNLFDFLETSGLQVKENLVLDQRCSAITISQRHGFLQMSSQIQYPFFPVIQRFGKHLTVDGLEQVRLLFSSEIALADSVAGAAQTKPLMYTSDRSGVMTGFFNLRPMENPFFNTLNQSGKVVGALARRDGAQGMSQVVLVGDSGLFDDESGGGFQENFVFVANVVDFLMGDSDLVALRSREITTRPLMEVDDAAKARWKWLNVLLPPVLIIAYGLLRWRREAGRARMLEEQYG